NFTFFADFSPNCVPRCNSLYCGDNSCGGDCGPCEEGETCSESNKCFPTGCQPDCTGKSCGDNGCGGECGSCPSPSLCVRGTGECTVFPTCDHFNPTCGSGCNETQYCGHDCKCYNLNAPLPDLIVSQDKLVGQVRIQTLEFAETDCAVKEGCILE